MKSNLSAAPPLCPELAICLAQAMTTQLRRFAPPSSLSAQAPNVVAILQHGITRSFSMASGLHLSPRSSSAAALKLLSRRRLQPHRLGALPRHESTMEAPELPPPS
ncbi:hypothetical protein Bca4012_083559 [Brassica carinata]